jgi:hypothetical protein
MPETSTATRADMADTALSNRYNVVNGQPVHVDMIYDGVAANPEDIFDGLGRIYGTAATLTTALTGANNDLTFTARRPGNKGNTVTVRYLDPAANNQTLAISVSTMAITTSLATGAGGAITSTAATIRDAINGDATASALVFAANAAANDGTGVVTAMAATALTGGDSKVTSQTDISARGIYRLRVSA